LAIGVLLGIALRGVARLLLGIALRRVARLLLRIALRIALGRLLRVALRRVSRLLLGVSLRWVSRLLLRISLRRVALGLLRGVSLRLATAGGHNRGLALGLHHLLSGAREKFIFLYVASHFVIANRLLQLHKNFIKLAIELVTLFKHASELSLSNQSFIQLCKEQSL